MASTKIPAIRAAVYKTLKAAESLKGITVADDKEPERQNEWVWIMKATAEREFRLIGPRPAKQDETVKVWLRIVALRGSKEAKPSEERVTEILEAVETALRDDASLEDTCFFHNIDALEIERIILDKKRGCHVVATVTAKTRI